MKLYLFFLGIGIFTLLETQIFCIQKLKKLPLDTSSFKTIVEDGYLYVDKTELIHSLIQSNPFCFLIRPRRFGRTLLLSVFQEIFSGNKKLFQNLWIGASDRYDWSVHPIIKLDFLMIDDHDPDRFEECLLYKIRSLGEESGMFFPENISIENATTELILKLSQRGKLVLLVDEYDKPLRRHQCDQQAYGKIELVLKKLYGTIGKFEDHFRAIVITGIVSYSAAMLFSVIPQLENISFSSQSVDLCGFTDEEMNTILFPYIERWAQQIQKTPADIIQKLREWYGGYRFALYAQSVYCPIPVLYSLNLMGRDSQWLETSIPNFLFQWMKTFPALFSSQKNGKLHSRINKIVDMEV